MTTTTRLRSPASTRAVLVAVVAASLALGGCGQESDAPAGHTVSMSGVMHKPGLQDATVDCVACHGATLRGGQGPSCYGCHGQRWN